MSCVITEQRELDKHACVCYRGRYGASNQSPSRQFRLPAVSRALIGVTLLLFRDTNIGCIPSNSQYRTGDKYVQNKKNPVEGW